MPRDCAHICAFIAGASALPARRWPGTAAVNRSSAVPARHAAIQIGGSQRQSRSGWPGVPVRYAPSRRFCRLIPIEAAAAARPGSAWKVAAPTKLPRRVGHHHLPLRPLPPLAHPAHQFGGLPPPGDALPSTRNQPRCRKLCHASADSYSTISARLPEIARLPDRPARAARPCPAAPDLRTCP